MYVISQRLLSQMVTALTALCSVLASMCSISAATECRMVTPHSYERLDVSWSSGANNVTIQLYACHDAANQRWRFVHLDNSYSTSSLSPVASASTFSAATRRMAQ